MLPALALAIAFAAIVAVVWPRYLRLKRERFRRDYPLPKGLYAKLRQRRPELSARDCALVARGLRQFFLAYLNAGRRYVAMPSQAADDLWHEFILYTRAYDDFCKQAFGGFLHHTPAVALGPERRDNEGLRRVWWQACREENIDPVRPQRLPLLFALDAKLGIAGGFLYAPDCKALKPADTAGGGGNVHCGGSFADSSVDGGTEGFGDGGGTEGFGDGGGTEGFGDGGGTDGGTGGDGGSGCGGGCGGGD